MEKARKSRASEYFKEGVITLAVGGALRLFGGDTEFVFHLGKLGVVLAVIGGVLLLVGLFHLVRERVSG